jgi:hypothetical protein
MRKKIEIKIGQKYNRLTILEELPNNNPRRVICSCSCGNKKTLNLISVLSNLTKSCGCLLVERNKLSQKNLTHGYSKTKTYRTWQSIKRRCYNTNAIDYKYYGERGIKVCDRWLQSFKNFLEDIREIPNGLTIDRIDVNGNYELTNCRLITMKEQSINKRNTKNKNE